MITVTVNGMGYSSTIGNLSFSTSESTLGMQVEFEILYRNKELVKVGDVVRLYEDNIPFVTGKVIDVARNGNKPRRVTCFDYGFYLNENEAIIQFKKIPADQALKKLLDRYGIKSKIVRLPYLINKIYKGSAVSEIIKDILDQCSAFSGIKYFFEMQDMMLVVAKRTDYEIKTPFTLLINPSVRESMQSMKNRVVVVSNKDTSTKVYTIAEDKASIKKYGLLQKVEEVDEKEIAKASKIAKEVLKDLNKIEFSGSFEVLANINVRANRIITVSDPITGLKGRYYIKSASHSVTSGKHSASVEVGAV